MAGVRVGVVFPQTELGGDVGAVRAYAHGVEQLGYTHLLAYDHVVGADPAVYKGWSGPYDVHTTFHEPFVLFGYVAAVTSLELVTGIIILPQRQTVLVAKQAAEVDLLTSGRFRLGVGLGRNAVEYEALGKNYSDRGVRSEEQVTLMRRLWTEQTVTHDGPSERVTAAGLAPLPVQRPIPIWFGAVSPRAYRRAGRLADGWFPMMAPGPELDAAKIIVGTAASRVGRDPAAIVWRAGPVGAPAASTHWSNKPSSGTAPGPHICRSTQWAPGFAQSTSTSRRWPKPQKAWASRRTEAVGVQIAGQ